MGMELYRKDLLTNTITNTTQSSFVVNDSWNGHELAAVTTDIDEAKVKADAERRRKARENSIRRRKASHN